jgi:hypothetical protein
MENELPLTIPHTLTIINEKTMTEARYISGKIINACPQRQVIFVENKP